MGIVVDPSYRAIPHAIVTLKTESSSEKRETETNESGAFKFHNVRPGSFELVISENTYDDLSLTRVMTTPAKRISLGQVILHFERPGLYNPEESWTWSDRDKVQHTRADFEEIVLKHWMWLEAGASTKEEEEEMQILLPGQEQKQESVSRPDLTAANLEKIALQRAVLSRAKLETADLGGANMPFSNLSGAVLVGTNLTGAHLYGANLSGAFLTFAHLNDAKLEASDLSNAYLDGADLSYADFGRAMFISYHTRNGADLSGAEMKGANLEGTTWDGANVSDVIFEPSSIPRVGQFKLARGLEFLTYDTDPEALGELGREFKEHGFDEEEEKINYALKRTRAEILWTGCTSWGRRGPIWLREKQTAGQVLWKEGRYGSMFLNCAAYFLNRIFLDLTYQYGMSPGRPLILLVVFWFLFSIFYVSTCIWRPRQPTGLYLVVKRMDGSSKKRVETQLYLHPQTEQDEFKRIIALLKSFRSLLMAGMRFSFTSLFNIDFGEVPTIKRWLSSLFAQQEQTEIKAVGWLRLLSGVQSVISLYLIFLATRPLLRLLE